MNDRMVWIDCEMTGLSLSDDALIEVAALVTDSELNVLGEGVDIVIRPPDAALETMPEVVRADAHRLRPARRAGRRHDAGGRRGAGPGVRTRAREGARQGPAVRKLGRHRPRLPRCGTCRRWRSYLHYRIVDVSSIKELARRWYPRAYFNSPEKNGNHRALADIRESIAELRYYREAVFVPQPGPDSDTAKTIAAKHVLPAR